MCAAAEEPLGAATLGRGALQQEIMEGLGFRVQGLGFRVWGLGFRVYGVAFGMFYSFLIWVVRGPVCSILQRLRRPTQYQGP